MAAGGDKRGGRRTVCVHKRARFAYEILETVEAGMVLRGTEVKSLRAGRVSLDEAFGRIDGDEAFLVGAHVQEYEHGNRNNHVPTRKRKLLLHRREIRKLKAKVQQKGFTLVPLEIFFSERGHAKLVLGLCRGKKLHDKRQSEKSKEAKRQIREAL